MSRKKLINQLVIFRVRIHLITEIPVNRLKLGTVDILHDLFNGCNRLCFYVDKTIPSNDR